ncbi:hypothetical protein LshimejAT787_0802210 [Lyophyllum shimeji]|uniref:Uncharacterized protein n=1 Tax=Lyophyllum shimeji TaxID=47721 RepID=A0A9P3PPN8_LYOSH|nr:hypothetical protein LshimejAT787_0802210 [Lyophyllum shimeji]
MFKRVEKRRRKREEEEELGLDEDMKEVLGMHDTDSEESASDSDESSDGAGSSVVSVDGAFEEGEDLDEVDDASESGEEEQPVITESFSRVQKWSRFTECPMHAHERRFKLFKSLASRAKPGDNAWDVLREHAEKATPSLAAPSEDSKRTQKRKARAALRKAKREKQKLKAKAKKAAASAKPAASNPGTMSPPPTRPPQKKQKVATPPPAPPPPTQTSRETAGASVKSIARSASDRAKLARARAANTRPKGASKATAS